MITRNNYEVFFVDYIDGNLSENQMAEFKAFLLSNPDLAQELDFVSTIRLEPAVGKFDKTTLKKEISDLPFEDKNADELMVSLLENDYPQDRHPELLQRMENSTDRTHNFNIFRKTKLQTPQVFMQDSIQLQRLPDFEKDIVTPENAQMFAIACAEGDLSQDATCRWLDWESENVSQDSEEFDFDKTKLIPDYTVVFLGRESLRRNHRRVLPRVAWYSTSIAAGMALMFGIWNGFHDEKITIINHTAQVITPVEQKTETLPTLNQTELKQRPMLNQTTVPAAAMGNRTNRHLEPMQPVFFKVNLDFTMNIEKVHGVSVDWSYALASAYEPEYDDSEFITPRQQENVPVISKKRGFIQFAQWGLSKLARNPERFKIETEYNEKNELSYFALQTPNFGFERKRK